MTKKPRFGVLGSGAICETMLPLLAALPSCELTAIASRSEGRARQVAAQYAIPHAFGSYQALLESGAADCVYIALPNALHVEWAAKALRLGHNVLCEKPLGVGYRETAELCALARECGRLLVEAYMYAHHPLYEALLSRLTQGAIGELREVSSAFTFTMDDPASVVASKALGGGALLDVGGYGVHLARLIAGSEPLAATAVAHERNGVDWRFFGLLEFESGLLGSFSAGLDSDERQSAIVTGTKGSFILESPWHPGESSSRLILRRHGVPDETIVLPGADAYAEQLKDFVAAAKGQKAPRFSQEDALCNMRAIEALRRAAERGQRVSLHELG